MLYVGSLLKHKCRICFHSNWLFFFPLSISIFQGQLLQGTIRENIKKELGKSILQLFAPEIHLSIFSLLFVISSILHSRKLSFPSSPLFVLPSVFVVSCVWSFVLVFKYIPCLDKKQHIKATRPKMGHLRLSPFLFDRTFGGFFCSVCVCASDILAAQFWVHRGWTCLSSQAVPLYPVADQYFSVWYSPSVAVPSHPGGQPGAAQNRSGCEESCTDSPFLHHRDSCPWGLYIECCKRKALKWLSGEGMGNACEESTEQ